MDNNTLNNLTINIDSFLYLNRTESNSTTILYPDIKKLLDITPEMRKQLLSKWKYYNEFLVTIDDHSNNQQYIKDIPWEQSFTMTLLLLIFN